MRMQNPVYIILWFGHAFTGLLIIILSVPLAMRRIKMNRWYGVRLAKAFESDENWYEINRLWARRAISWSTAFIVVSGVAAFFLELSSESSVPLTILYASSPLVLVLILVVEALRCSKKIP